MNLAWFLGMYDGMEASSASRDYVTNCQIVTHEETVTDVKSIHCELGDLDCGKRVCLPCFLEQTGLQHLTASIVAVKQKPGNELPTPVIKWSHRIPV